MVCCVGGFNILRLSTCCGRVWCSTPTNCVVEVDIGDFVYSSSDSCLDAEILPVLIEPSLSKDSKLAGQRIQAFMRQVVMPSQRGPDGGVQIKRHG